MSDLEDALTITNVGVGRWKALADPRYESTNSMFGGWTAAVILRSVLADAGHAMSPSAITINYISMIPAAAEVVIRVTELGGSRSLNHYRAELCSISEDRMFASAIILLSARGLSDGFTEPHMPPAPSPESLDLINPPGSYGQRTIRRPVEGFPPFNRDSTSSIDWVRDMTGRRVDYCQLAYLSDSYTPRSFFWSSRPRLSATISMTVHFHATDKEVESIGDDYLLIEATGVRGSDRTCGQQSRLWRRDGTLLTSSVQMHWFR
jgi:Thioesterase-like superfamily